MRRCWVTRIRTHREKLSYNSGVLANTRLSSRFVAEEVLRHPSKSDLVAVEAVTKLCRPQGTWSKFPPEPSTAPSASCWAVMTRPTGSLFSATVPRPSQGTEFRNSLRNDGRARARDGRYQGSSTEERLNGAIAESFAPRFSYHAVASRALPAANATLPGMSCFGGLLKTAKLGTQSHL